MPSLAPFRVLLPDSGVGVVVIYGLLVYGFYVMNTQHWTRDTHGLVALYASLALAIFLLRDIKRLGDRAENYIAGGDAEEAVGAQLRPLRDEGWVVVDNVVRDDGDGNVDHFASAPGGQAAYAIETKSGKTRAGDRGQAISNAIWAKQRFGALYVTAVLCVGKDAPEQPTQVPHGRSTVWVIGRPDLARWLRTLPR
jgi:Nuclease-related domain